MTFVLAKVEPLPETDSGSCHAFVWKISEKIVSSEGRRHACRASRYARTARGKRDFIKDLTAPDVFMYFESETV